MKSLVLIFLILVGNSAVAASTVLNCRVDMRQFKSDAKLTPLIGDSNQRFVFTLIDDGSGRLTGESQVRFLNDQSDDPSNSLYGARAVALYQEGDGLMFSMQILKFVSTAHDAQFEMIGGAAGVADVPNSIKESASHLLFAFINPKAFDPRLDLWDLVKSGSVKDYELYRVSFEGCFTTSR